MVDEFDNPDQRLLFTLDTPASVPADLLTRIQHCSAWCLEHDEPFEFFHIFNRGAELQPKLRSRLIKLTPKGDEVSICCEPETPHPPPSAMMHLVNQISDRMPDGLAVASFTGDEQRGFLTFVNQTMLDIFQLERGEMLGRSETSLAAHNYQEISASELHETQLDLVRGDGSTFMGKLKRKVMRDVTGWPSLAVITCQDVDHEESEYSQREQRRKLNERMQLLGKMGWWELDIPSGELYWSRGMFEIYQQAFDEVEPRAPAISATMSQVVEADHSRMQKMLQLTVEHQQEASAEVRVLSGGEERWLRMQTSPGRIDNGVVKSILGTTIDITETVQSEQLRVQQHQELEFYLACLDESTLLLKLDQAFNITFANQKFLDTLQFSTQELYGRNLSVLGHGLNVTTAYESSIRQHETWRGELIQFNQSGARVILDVTMSSGPSGPQQEILFLASDVTNRKLIERVNQSVTSLQRSGKSAPELVTQALHSLIEITDSVGGVLKSSDIDLTWPRDYVAQEDLPETNFEIRFHDKSPGQLKLLGRPGGYETEVRDILRPLVHVIAEVERERQRSILDKKQEFENRFILESLKIGSWRRDFVNSGWIFSESLFDMLEYPASAGGVVPIELWEQRVPQSEQRKLATLMEKMLADDDSAEVVVIGSLPDGRSKFIKVQGRVVRDARGEVVEAIGIASDVSDEVVTRRELENQKSLASHQARLASIGELAAGVGHEINNPLTIIRGFLEIVKNNLNSPAPRIDELTELITKMDDSAGRIEKIVRGLRSLSHVDVTGTVYFSADPILRDTVAFVDEIYRRHGVELEMVSEVPMSARLCGHEGKLQQVLMNLLSNARDATEEQAERKIVAHFSVSDNNLLISVQDNGPGVDESIRERIFHPFFTTKDIGKGTGIGLSMVYSIVQEFHGQVECRESNLGGAEFAVTLPLAEEVKLEHETEEDQNGPFGKEFAGRMLVVDDEDGVREFLMLMLGQIGLTVDAVSNGRLALEKIFTEAEQYDAVITDLTMPEMGGLEFVRELQHRNAESPVSRLPRVLLSTGRPDFSYDQEAYPAVVGVLHKPFNLELLKEKLEQLL